VKAPDTVRVELEPPLDVPGSLAALGRWGDDGLDRWDGTGFLRTLRDGDRVVPFAGWPGGSVDAPWVDVASAKADLPRTTEVVRAMFVAAPSALADLSRHDPAIARLDAAYPGIRPVLHRDPLTALIRSISAQQVNLTWATEIRRRLALAYGTEHAVGGETVRSLDAERLAAATIDDLRTIQLTNAKARSVIAVARAALDGQLRLADLERLDDEAVAARLVALPGIGPWSADWFLARTLGRPRVAAGDLGVRKAVGRAYLEGRLPSESEVRALTAHWGAAAGVAQQLILQDLVAGAPA